MRAPAWRWGLGQPAAPTLQRLAHAPVPAGGLVAGPLYRRRLHSGELDELDQSWCRYPLLVPLVGMKRGEPLDGWIQNRTVLRRQCNHEFECSGLR